MQICSFANDHSEFVYFYQETLEKIYTPQFLTDCKNILQHSRLCLCFLNELLMYCFWTNNKEPFPIFCNEADHAAVCALRKRVPLCWGTKSWPSLIYIRFISTFYLVLRNFDYYSNILYYIPVSYSRPAAALKLYCALTFYGQ